MKDFRTEVLNLSKATQIDDKYFEETNGGYKATSFLIYKTNKGAEKYFKRKILKLDTAGKYTDTKEGVLIVDKEDKYFAEKEFEKKYEKQYEAYNAEWDAYRKSHPDEFIEGDMLFNQHDENIYLNGYSAEVEVTADEAAAAYIWAVNENKNTDTSTIEPRQRTTASKTEFKDIHKQVRSEIRKKVGLPVFKDQYVEKKVTGKDVKLKRNTKKSIWREITPEIEKVNEYFEGFVEYLTSVDKKSFLDTKTQEEEAITENFVHIVDNTAKSFKPTFDTKTKAVALAINLDTLEEDLGVNVTGRGIQEVLTIKKDDLKDDNYEYYFRYNSVDGQQIIVSSPITFKAQLIKQLTATIKMIEAMAPVLKDEALNAISKDLVEIKDSL